MECHNRVPKSKILLLSILRKNVGAKCTILETHQVKVS